MIYNLRKKFIMISAGSVSIVFAVIFGIIYIVTTTQLNQTMDMLTDVISENNGMFPKFEEIQNTPPPPKFPQRKIFSPDTQFSTRFFTIWTDETDTIIKINRKQILSVTEKQAQEYAILALKNNKPRGWISNYRYKVEKTEQGKRIVFVHGEMNRGTTLRLLYSVFAVMVGSFIIILLLIIFISKTAVRTAAESYEKQRQFVTDANHELKTPLTLILSNLDIIEAEIGENEWLQDIRSEGNRMGILINQLVTLSRMDEDTAKISPLEFAFSDMVADVVSEFSNLAMEKNKHLSASIQPGLRYVGDEGLIRRLLSIYWTMLSNTVTRKEKFL